MRLLPCRGVVICALLAAATGCASFSGVGPDSVRLDRRSRNLLDTRDLRQVETLNAYEAIRRLQPRWLSGRGQSVMVSPEREGVRVYLDGMYYGDAGILKRMSVRTIQEIRFLSAADATLRYGTGHSDGALDIYTRQGFRAR